MPWFHHDSEEKTHYDQLQSKQHEGSLTHEIIAGAAAYEASKAYEEHCAREGKPQSHAQAKEILAGFVGAFVDREVESKGLDWLDREKAKRHAKEKLEGQVAQDYM